MTARTPVSTGLHRLPGEGGRGVPVGDMATTSPGQLTGLDRTLIAAHALCSERTVKRYLEGKMVSTSTRMRIEAALVARGLAGAVRAVAS